MSLKKNTKEKITNIRFSVLNVVMVAVAFLVTAFAIITGSYVTDTETVTVGTVAGQRYVATRDVENTLATQKLQEEAADSIGELYKHNVEVQNNAVLDVSDYFQNVGEALLQMEKLAIEEYSKAVSGLTGEDLNDVYMVYDYDLDVISNLPIIITPAQAEAYHELTRAGKTQFQEEITGIVESAYEERIYEENLGKFLEQGELKVEESLWQKDLHDLAKEIVTVVIKPNLVVDEEAMEVARQKRISEVVPVMVLKNQKIVDEGEVVNEEAFTILTDLGLINKSYAGSTMPFVGSIAIVLMCFISICIYLKTQQPKVIMEPNSMLVVFAIYMLVVAILILISDLKAYYLIPVSLFAMLASLLVRTKLALILNSFVSLFALFIFNGGADFLVYYLITGSFAALLVQYTKRRAQTIFVASAMGFVHMAVYISVHLFFVKDFSMLIFEESIFAAVIGVVTVVVAIGSLPLWEALFGINTRYTLVELLNPNNEIMHRLMVETPGTYHHCLVVANLAETAAYDIHANSDLARVGAYYHDIGKLANPNCFSENQFGENIHNNLDPYISAKMIIDHVKDGTEMARKNKVPKIVRDIVEQHHGTSIVKYFYFKSTQNKASIEIEEDDFRYKGPIPQFKEAAIVMLADTVEAAVRSNLSEQKSIGDISNLINALFKDKLNDGQLDECRLDLKEINIIKESFLKVFNGMYHDRIVYPKMEDIEEARKEQLLRKQEEENDGSN